MTARPDSFEGLHVLLVTEDDSRALAIAKSLRERKAHVGDVRAGGKDPVALRGADLLVIDARRGASTDARVNEVRSDVRARWASVATIDYTTLAGGEGTVDLRALEGIVSRLAGMDKALTERARRETSFETTLAPLGPTRTLRALALAGPTLHVELTDGTLSAKVDLADELLVAAFAERKGERWEAWSALARVLGMTDANVVVTQRAHPSAMNIMEPVDQALEGAAQERVRSPELFAEEQVDELSGLRHERKENSNASAVVPELLAESKAASSGSGAPARVRPSVPSPHPEARSAVASAPPAQVIAVPNKSSSPRPSFADTPTDPAAPGLLQRMARAPANDGDEKPRDKVPAKPAPAPVVSFERTTFDDDDDFENDDGYDAGEVTVVADASQLDILRETLERLDGEKRPLTSTMPAPPGPGKQDDELAMAEALKSASGAKPAADWPADFELPPLSVPPPSQEAVQSAAAANSAAGVGLAPESSGKPSAAQAASLASSSATSRAPAPRGPTLRHDSYPERGSPPGERTKTRALILVALLLMAALALGAMYWSMQQRRAAVTKSRAKPPSAPTVGEKTSVGEKP